MGILRFAGQADTVSPPARSSIRMIDAPCYLAVADVVQI